MFLNMDVQIEHTEASPGFSITFDDSPFSFNLESFHENPEGLNPNEILCGILEGAFETLFVKITVTTDKLNPKNGAGTVEIHAKLDCFQEHENPPADL